MNRADVAAVLREHRANLATGLCGCGERLTVPEPGREDALIDHVADVLAQDFAEHLDADAGAGIGCPCGLPRPHPADGSPCWHPAPRRRRRPAAGPLR